MIIRQSLTISSLFLILFGSQTASGEQASFNGSKTETVSARVVCGNFTITESSDQSIHVRTEKVRWANYCSYNTKVSGSKISLKITENKILRGNKDCCEMNFEIKIPANKSLDIKSTAGTNSISAQLDSVRIKNSAGSLDISNSKINTLDFDLAGGNVSVKKSTITKSEGKIGGGNFEGDGLFNEFSMKQGAGNFDLTLEKIPAEGFVSINAGSGNISISLPKGSKIDADIKKSIGNFENFFPQTSGAKFKLKINSGIGNTSIKQI